MMMLNGRQQINLKSAERLETNQEFSCEKFNWLIHLQHVRGEIQACKNLIKRELERCNNKNEFAMYKQGEILREEGDLQQALESFQNCVKLNPNNSENVKEVAKCLYEMRRYKLAVDAYAEAAHLAKNPDWQTLYYSGKCHLKLGNLSKAKEQAQAAVKVSKHEICYSLLIKILTIEGDLKSAVAVSNAAVESCPDSVTALNESGLLLLKVGQTQLAFERFSSALALDPVNPKALLGIGYITQKHEEFDVALTKYKLAIHNEPMSVALWNNVGLCFNSKDKHTAAISCLKRALWLQPLNWRSSFNIALTYLATSQPASSFNFACAAVNLRPDVADCFTLLSASLLELQDAENAVQSIKHALNLCPDDAIIALNAALCCQRAKMRQEAVKYFELFQNLTKEAVNGENSAPWLTQEVMNLAEALTNVLDKDEVLHEMGPDEV